MKTVWSDFGSTSVPSAVGVVIKPTVSFWTWKPARQRRLLQDHVTSDQGCIRFFAFLTTDRLTPRSRALVEKAVVPQLVKKFSFYWTRGFTTAFTRLSTRSCTEPNQSSPFLHPTSHTCYMPCLSNSSWFDHPNSICWGERIMRLLVM